MFPNLLLCQHILICSNNIFSAFQAILTTLGFPEHLLGRTCHQIHFKKVWEEVTMIIWKAAKIPPWPKENTSRAVRSFVAVSNCDYLTLKHKITRLNMPVYF